MEKILSEDYCSYEVAKLLKEKGFDELTNLVWYQHLPTSLDCRNLVNKKARDYFYHNETTEHNSSYKNSRHKPEYIHGDIFSCPTHQMAMKWLREVHKLFIDISFQKDEDGSVTWFYMTWALDDRKRDVEEVNFPSYEEAVEAALKYCLTNLI